MQSHSRDLGATVSLYRGLLANATGSFFATGTFVAIYNPIRLRMEATGIRPSLAALYAVLLADVLTVPLRCPFEVLKQRVQAGAAKSTLVALLAIIKSGQVAIFWQGLLALWARDLAFDAIQFPIVEGTLHALGYGSDRTHKAASASLSAGVAAWMRRLEIPDAVVHSTVGMVGGATAAGLSTPLDVAKTRLAVQRAQRGTTHHYRGVLHCIRTVAKTEGLGTLFRSAPIRMTWMAAGGAIFFPVLKGADAWLQKTL